MTWKWRTAKYILDLRQPQMSTSNLTSIHLSITMTVLPNLPPSPSRYTFSDSLIFGPWLWRIIGGLTSPTCPHHFHKGGSYVPCPWHPKWTLYQRRCGDQVGRSERRLRKNFWGNGTKETSQDSCTYYMESLVPQEPSESLALRKGRNHSAQRPRKCGQ